MGMWYPNPVSGVGVFHLPSLRAIPHTPSPEEYTNP